MEMRNKHLLQLVNTQELSAISKLSFKTIKYSLYILLIC